MPTYENSIQNAMFTQDASLLTDDQVAMFRDNPELLDLIGDRETIFQRNMWWLLLAAFLLVATSKALTVKYGDDFELFFFNTIADLIFEMGAALIGSVATVLFLNRQKKRQFAQNLKFRSDLMKRIEALGG